MNTDPIADMLTRIRNAGRARHDRVDVPKSKLKVKIAEILKQEGYLSEIGEVSTKNNQGIIELRLAYDRNHEPVIGGIKRVSKPGLRKYLKAEDIPKVRNGLGVLVLSTSKGLMTDREARKQHIGGEALCAVW